MIAWLKKAWRWIVMVAVGLVCALVPGVLWIRERRRRKVLERSIEIQSDYMVAASEAMRAKDAALTELGHQLDQLRVRERTEEAEDTAEREVMVGLEPSDAWERAFGGDRK